MSKTTFTGYVPSLKAKHEATITNGKAIESKGGSIRYTIQGEYEGRKTFPKTVSKHDFENVYGFDAKAAEDAVIALNADTVGEPTPASVEPPAPSEKPFPQEPTNADFSATTERVIITLGDDDEEDEEEIEEETEDEDEEEDDSVSDENGEDEDSDEEKDEKVEDEDEEQEEEDEDEEDSEEEDEDEEEFEAISVEVEREKKEDKDEDEDEDGLLTPMNVALGLGAVALGVAVLGAETNGDQVKLFYEGIYENDEDEDDERNGQEIESYSLVNKQDYIDYYHDTKYEPCPCDVQGCLSCFLDEASHTPALKKGGISSYGMLWFEDTELNALDAEDSPEPTFDEGITGQDGPSAEPTNADFSAEGVCVCGIDCDCDCGCAESGVCNCGESCPCDCGCGVESFGTDSLVEEPDWIPDGDGRALGQQNLDINLSPLHAEQNEYHTSNVFYADGEDLTSSEFVPFDQITSEIQQEWDETTAPIAADYEPSNEPTNANFSAEDKRCSSCFEIVREGSINEACNGEMVCDDCWNCWFCDKCDACTDHQECECGCEVCGYTECECDESEAETVGSPSPTFNEGITGQDGPSAEPTNADFSANWSMGGRMVCESCGDKDGEYYGGDEYLCRDCVSEPLYDAETTGLSKNAQYAIGLAALGVGIALWNGDWVSKMFDRFKR